MIQAFVGRGRRAQPTRPLPPSLVLWRSTRGTEKLFQKLSKSLAMSKSPGRRRAGERGLQPAFLPLWCSGGVPGAPKKKLFPEMSKSLAVGGWASLGSSPPSFPSGAPVEYQGHRKTFPRNVKVPGCRRVGERGLQPAFLPLWCSGGVPGAPKNFPQKCQSPWLSEGGRAWAPACLPFPSPLVLRRSTRGTKKKKMTKSTPLEYQRHEKRRE